ncbi:MAG: hypothetical protein LBP75_09000 [Planctomycetota bacterium]|nr:hypothetical protein [Planctomycetota bacterium]
MPEISIALTERRCFSGNANPARREIDTADFPLGWAVTLCRFAATVGKITTAVSPANRAGLTADSPPQPLRRGE